MTPEPHWTKSSYSSNGGNCVEIATNLATYGTIPVRDSKDPHGPALTFDTSAWSAFVASLKAGGFTA
ncbi:DUF397 domain-containing protein [Streptomyces sp. AC536]|uniref:DUF397 domain-containing protein n=1 Tax=Streptomyces buecherae TaxID=2763006 RepID=UPI00164EBFB9|nr:DUF397 domain-containing protein [Streptomyces buecherae]MBC3985527.1 DUF397 domain-containing protein [Streptomyces buecherae]QNJ44465.1 DUF397 domain-containing protein [Streptomyces buecherae]